MGKLSFSKNVKDVKYRDGKLSCILLLEGEARVSINLNKGLGNDNGEFEIGGKNFSQTATMVNIQKRGSKYFLVAWLKQANGFSNFDSEIDLDRVLIIKNGGLIFNHRQRSPSPRRRRRSPSPRRRRRSPSPRRRRRSPKKESLNSYIEGGLDVSCNIL